MAVNLRNWKFPKLVRRLINGNPNRAIFGLEWDGTKKDLIGMMGKIYIAWSFPRIRWRMNFMQNIPMYHIILMACIRYSGIVKIIFGFGTSSLGIYRFDGEQLSWMYDHQLTETPEGGSFGIRSIAEDQDGFHWICNVNYKFSILDNNDDGSELHSINYHQQKGIENKEIANQYFLSMLVDQRGDFWMASYDNGVWRKSGNDLIHYPITEKNEDVHLLSLCLDKQGELWLNTQGNGTYKHNGDTFEKFTIG